MKTIIFTTNTLHHTYFIKELSKIFLIEGVFLETGENRPSFAIKHPFEKKRDSYELKTFFNNKMESIGDYTKVFHFISVNDSEAYKQLQQLQPDIIIVFGTGIIKKHVIDLMGNRIINLHGGDPEEYRGLDSHLWAIYHKDFKSLVTTLHHVNEKIDDGKIIFKKEIPVFPAMQLHELRRYNTEICVQLAMDGLEMFKKTKELIANPQIKKGRYYSYMPAVLKDTCIKHFEKYTGYCK